MTSENSPDTGPKVPFTSPFFPPEMRREIAEDIQSVLACGRLMDGPFAKKIEADFAHYSGTKHAVSLNSATTGLQIALRFAGASGREVLVPAASFVTDVTAVLFEGATPVLVDCDPATLALDPADLARKIGPETAAIIWVHLTGYIGDKHQEIERIAQKNGVLLIEDASHAYGAEIDGRISGSLGHVGIFSLYPTKLITSGTGGLLTTDDPEIAKFARKLRLFGKDEETGEITDLGNDWFLDELRACVASHQVAALDVIINHRRSAANRYLQRIGDLPGFRCLVPNSGNLPSWYQFPIFLDADIDHNVLSKKMRESGIPCKRIYRPVHHETVFRPFDPGNGLEGAEQLLDRSFCLPMFTAITDAQIDQVVNALKRALGDMA